MELGGVLRRGKTTTEANIWKLPLGLAEQKESQVNSQGTNREHALGTYRTPSQSCSCEHGGARADEVSWLVLGAKVRDIREHPHLYSNRHEA